jgi:hypothetical protein
MHTISTSTQFAALAAMFLSPVLFAQDEKPAKAPATTPEYCSSSKIVGATVRMAPGAESRREAEKEGETAKRPEGKIDDVIVDRASGGLKYAVISFGGFLGINDKTVAVPCSELTWIPAHERFEVASSEDRLRALPPFDLSKARKTGLDAAATTIETQWNEAAKAAGTKGDTKEPATKEPARQAQDASMPKLEAKPLAGTPFHTMPVHYITLTEVDDYPVYAGSEKFGAISDLLVDRDKRSLALVVLKRGGALGIGGTEYLIPYRAVNYCSSGEERVHCLCCDTGKLETAVVYEKPKHGVVDAAAAKRALESKTFDKVDEKDGKSAKRDGG